MYSKPTASAQSAAIAAALAAPDPYDLGPDPLAKMTLDEEADLLFGPSTDEIHDAAKPLGYGDPPDMKHINDAFTPPERVDDETGEVLSAERAVHRSYVDLSKVQPIPKSVWDDTEKVLAALAVDDVIEPLAVSHAKRDAIVTERFTRLMALHGPGSRWDNLRKIRLSLAKQRARADNADKKVTEALLDDLAHADEEYQKFVYEGIAEASELEGLRAKLQTLDDVIRRSDALLRLKTAEARLAT